MKESNAIHNASQPAKRKQSGVVSWKSQSPGVVHAVAIDDTNDDIEKVTDEVVEVNAKVDVLGSTPAPADSSSSWAEAAEARVDVEAEEVQIVEPVVEEEAKVQVVVVQMVVGAAEAGAKVVQVVMVVMVMEVVVPEALMCALGSAMELVVSRAEVLMSPSVFTSCTNKMDMDVASYFKALQPQKFTVPEDL
eukprot:g2496.t1